MMTRPESKGSLCPAKSTQTSRVLFFLSVFLLPTFSFVLHGRLVRTWNLQPYTLHHTPYTQVFEWDGTDRNGLRRAPGVYFVRLETQNASATGKVILVNEAR